MKIDLNATLVTKEGILSHIQDIDIYRFYTGKDVDLTKKIKSPLTEKDDNPSFGYFITEKKEIFFNDFRLGGGDFVKFVQLLFGLDFFEAMSKIVVDFNLTPFFHYKKSYKTTKKFNPNNFQERDKILLKANTARIGKKSRKWEEHDLRFWYRFGIDINILRLYNVQPIQYIFIDKKPIAADKYAYAFMEFKDGIETIKIYQPFNKQYKWLTSHDASVWQGWDQLPKTGETLIITKSLKDVMAIKAVMNMNAIALQNEKSSPKPKIIQELKARFTPQKIYLLYDNDYDKEVNWGREFGKKIAEEHMLFQIEIDDVHKSKDFSDLVKNKGREKAKEILTKKFKLPF